MNKDIVYRQDAIDAINSYFGFDGEYGSAVQEIINGLPPAQPEQKWIPCSERLPEKDDVYLVYAPYYSGGSSSSKENHKGVMFSKHKNGKWSIEHGYHKRPNCVIAWMPLPEPYKEDQGDEL